MERRTVLVTGTGTEIGKTWVTAAAVHVMRRRGIPAQARKPVQSFEPGTGATDAEVLAAASSEDVHVVCPEHRWYEVPMAPPMAAEALGREPFSISDLVSEIALGPEGITFVEGAGGPRSPLADDGDTVDLCDALDPHTVVIVADAGLGTINALQLSREAFPGRRVIGYLNRYDARQDLHQRNRRWLVEVSGLDVVVDCDELVDRLTQEDG